MTRIECESRRQAEAIRDRLLLKLPRRRSVGTLPATGPNVKRWATYVDATKDEVRDALPFVYLRGTIITEV